MWTKSALITCLVSLVCLVSLPPLSRAQAPAYGPGIVVDGDAQEWDLVHDHFAPMYKDGNPDPLWPGHAVLSHLFLRYDCVEHVMGVLVLDEDGDGLAVDANPDSACFRIYAMGWPNDLLVDGNGAGGTPFRSFAWVHAIPGDPLSPVVGFEAAAQLDAAVYAAVEARVGVAGEIASTGKHSTGFDENALDALMDNLNDPGTIQIRVHYPYEGGSAYFPGTEIDLDGNGAADVTLDAWCIDTDHTINNNAWYCADLISSYHYPAGFDDTRWQNLDVVNWILNQGFVGQPAPPFGTYTYGDVQYAVWSVIDNASSPNGLGSWDINRVNMILTAATAAVGMEDPAVNYEPPCDGVVGVIIVPTDCGSGQSQILVGQMLVSEYPAFCNSYEIPLIVHCQPGTVDLTDAPAAFSLAPASPNPFNPETVLTVSLPETGPASLRVYDMSGRLVATLLDGMGEAGTREYRFQAGQLPSGMYVAVLRTGQAAATQKLMLVK